VKTKGYYIIENIESFRDSLLTDACIIEGFVYDARTSETLSHGTAITYNGNNNPVIIDKNGFFRYVLKPSTYQVRFIRAGYYDLITDSLELSLNEKIILSVFLGSSVVY
jgi:hypothetical protein